MNLSTKSLIIFVSIQVINSTCLIIDYILLKTNNTTITEYCIKYPLLGIPIVVFECFSPISIGLHFYTNNDDDIINYSIQN